MPPAAPTFPDPGRPSSEASSRSSTKGGADGRPLPGDEELVAVLHVHLAALFQPGLGRRLVDVFGGAPAVLAQPRARLAEVDGVRPAVLRRLLGAATAAEARRELERARAEDIRLLVAGTSGYPQRLTPLDQMPLVLFQQGAGPWDRAPACTGWGTQEGGNRAMGALNVQRAPCIGMVGTRRPSLYGLKQARHFAGEFARRGLPVISGLARGVDAAAHESALAVGGSTVAVLGSGFGQLYPREHTALAERIRGAPHSALVTEFPFEMTPRSFHFPLRNRVLSGLSDAILVVEAGQKSGSLITVRHALDQGRSVFALPGRVDHPEALGCLQLLRDGAAPAIHPADVAAEFFGAEVLETWDRRGTNEKEGAALERSGGLGPSLRRLFASQDRWHPNQLAEALGVSFSALLEELNRLEISGSLLRLPGGFYACGPLEERE